MKNITLAYIINTLNYSWFWLGVWIFYYLNFTNYAGIGLIETALIITRTSTEIPAGAIADLLGKRKTIILSGILSIISSAFMAFAFDISFLIISTCIGGISGALYSGTLEALVYDTLKDEKKEKDYDKIWGNINSFQFIIIAISVIVGGYLYIVNNRLPFILTGLFGLASLFFSIFLTEPRIDTVKFSFRNLLVQNTKGFTELFSKIEVRKFIIIFLIISSFIEISDEILNDAVAIEIGFSPVQLGIFLAVLAIAAAIVSKYASLINKKFKKNMSLASGIYGIGLSVSYIVAELSYIFGTLGLVLRTIVQSLFNIFASDYLNKNIESKYRATTLSSFYMIRNIPYVLSAYFLGSLMDLITARKFSFYMGVGLFLILLIFLIIQRRTSVGKKKIS